MNAAQALSDKRYTWHHTQEECGAVIASGYRRLPMPDREDIVCTDLQMRTAPHYPIALRMVRIQRSRSRGFTP